MGRRRAPLHGLGSRFVPARRTRELERGKRADELRVDAANVLVGVPKHLVLLVTQEDVAATASDLLGDQHLDYKTGSARRSFPRQRGQSSLSTPFDASA
jgi:hypothetical protein